MWDAWLDLVHGSSCAACGRPGRALCGECEAILCRWAEQGGGRVCPDPCPPGLTVTLAAGEYADPVRALVVAHKERQVLSLARPLGALLASVVGALLDAAPPGTRTLLTPMPSRAVVVRRRGHDPMLRISRYAAALLRRAGLPVEVAALLEHRLPVADQAGLSASERRANLVDGLVLRPRARAALVRSGEPVRTVVCDDVVTTGASVREAQRALEDAGVPVLGIACVAATMRRHRTGVRPAR